MPTLGIILQTIIVLYLIIGEPLWGRQKYAELTRTAPHDPTARSRFYTWVIALEWGLVLLTGVGVILSGAGPGWLGFQSPTGVAGVLLPVAMGAFLVGLLLSLLLARFSPKAREGFQTQMDGLRPLLPLPGRERWLFAAVAVTAGICEETLFRGLLIGWAADLLPGLPQLALGALSAVVFGMAHLYQGWKGVLQAGVLGGVFALLYLATGSLWPPIVLHALVDLRLLAMIWVVETGRC